MGDHTCVTAPAWLGRSSSLWKVRLDLSHGGFRPQAVSCRMRLVKGIGGAIDHDGLHGMADLVSRGAAAVLRPPRQQSRATCLKSLDMLVRGCAILQVIADHFLDIRCRLSPVGASTY